MSIASQVVSCVFFWVYIWGCCRAYRILGHAGSRMLVGIRRKPKAQGAQERKRLGLGSAVRVGQSYACVRTNCWRRCSPDVVTGYLGGWSGP